MTEINGDNRDKSIEEAVQKFVHELSEGQEPDIDEFVKQYSGLEQQLRKRIRNLQKIDTLFNSLFQADKSDFDDAQIIHDLIGRKVGSFDIVKVIGRGGMGVVYLANDTKLERSVAIKTIPDKLAEDSAARMRFQREAKILASLNHPNIAVIHDIIEPEEDTGYLVLEYIPGQTLAQRIAHKPFKPKEALSIAEQIAEAVSAAHKKGIVHRDLKPGNIKIMPEGRVKVLDFGLAKPAGEQVPKQDSVVTQVGSIIGTPAYMSPEQIRGGSTDSRTDIWSFGCILYEMLTGKRPFEGDTVSDTVAHILEHQPDWQALPQETPANIRVLLSRCLEKSADQRLGDIEDAAIEISETLSRLTSTPKVTIPTKSRRMTMIIGAVIIIVLSAITVWFILEQQTQPLANEIRLAVLPFENLGPAEDEYFADGITDAITARLAGLHGLAVISRQSAIQYKNSDKSAQEIGKELGVDYILEGTVQREQPSDPNSTIRIMPQLIRAYDDTHVWSNIFDNDMSKIFQVQSDVAEQIAQALDVTLLDPERQALATRLTDNTKAYEYYLRGNKYVYRSILENDLRIAIQMYEKAIELDPEFALAYAEVSRAHVRMYWRHYDHSDARIAMAKKAIDEAFRLDPDQPEVRLALGHYHYQGHTDYERALQQLENARKGQPSNSEVIYFIAAVQRRQGKITQSMENFKKAAELDPRSGRIAEETGDTLMRARKFTEAEQYFERAIWLAPHMPEPYERLAMLYLLRDGRTDRARAIMQEGLQNVDSTSPEFDDLLVKLYMYDRNYQEALDQLTSMSENIDSQFYFIPKAQLYAQIYDLIGNQQLKEVNYELARNISEAKIQQQPNDARFHSSLGIVYAGLGRKEDAIREGLLGIELLPVSKDAWRGCYRVEDLARIYVMVGEFDKAIEQLKFLLDRPSEMPIPLLQLDPAWNPLRNHPRFEQLMQQNIKD